MADRELFQAEAIVWADALYRAALSLCAQPSTADDLVQSTYLKAWERFDQFRTGTNCRAWLLTILRNVWVDFVRRQSRVSMLGNDAIEQLPAAPERPDPPARGDEVDVVEQFDNEKLAAAFSNLPDGFRLALFLVDIEGYSHQEAAEVLGVPTGTVKSRTSRARRMILERLSATAPDSPDVPARVAEDDAS